MRRVTAALALVFAVLVIAQPAAAAHTVVVSSHSTESEFDAGALTNTSTTANAVVYNPGEGSTVSREADSGTKSSNDQAKHGLRVDVKSDLDGLNITLSSNTGGATTAYITETDGTVISSASISGGQANISANLDAGQEYNVVVDADGSSYNIGVDSFPNFPYTSNDVDIRAGIEGSSFRSGQAYAIKTVEAWKTGSGDGEYISQNHTGSRITAGFANLTLTDAEAIVTWEGSNGGSWNQVATQTYTTDGNKSLDLSGTNYDTWRVNVTFVVTGSSPSGKLYTEGIEFDARTPSVDNGSASPSGGAQVASSPTYQIDVEDGDFPTAQSDTLTAEWYRNGTKLGETTVTTNGTATFSPSTSKAGVSAWHVEFTDEYGHTQTSDTFTYETPSELRLYQETSPEQLVTGTGINITVRFFPLNDQSNVVSRTTTDGTVDLSGLPANERFVVTARENSSDYVYRRIVVDSLFDTQRVYLLNASEPSSQVVFELQDPAGLFPPENTILYVERPLNVSGSTQYEVIAGDTFGATGRFPVTLQDSTRYRLRVETVNGTNERVLGAYSVYEPVVEQLQIKRIEPSSDVDAGASVYGDYDDGRVTVRHRDLGNSTKNVTYRITQDGSVVVANTTTDSEQFAHVYTFGATNNTTSYTVEWWAYDENETLVSGEFGVGQVNSVATRFDVDPQVMSIISWGLILAAMGLVVIVEKSLAPLAGSAMAAGLVIVGAVAIPMPILGIAGAISVFAVFGGGGR